MIKKVELVLKKIAYYSILNRRAFLEEEKNENEILKILEKPLFEIYGKKFDNEFDDIFNLSPLTWKEEECKKCFWLSERIGVLLWGINLLENVPPFDTPFDIGQINDILQKIADSKDDIKYELRSRKELIDFFKLVDLFSWRAGMYLMKMNNILPPKPYTYESMFEMIMDKVFKEGLIKKNEYNDVIIMDKPYMKLNKSEFFLVAAITKERESAIKILLDL